MIKWDYDVRTLADADRLPVLKKMGSEGWELIGLKDEPRSGTTGQNDYATYITYWFKRPIAKYTMDQLLVEEEESEFFKRMAHAMETRRTTVPVKPAPDSNAWGDGPFASSKPNFVLADPTPETLNLTVVIDDQTKILRIMSEAGWYVKDVSKDRKVDGAFVTYMFTKRQKKETGVAYELEE